ncbi:PREDICTED: pro-neuregulin-1, membrane-bound isoform-like, partial [Phaethon lepturus]|uniref:pro-neuregulin-1, membrane-bound isoform-like n=1 Tax=Phaethon lepturus TaxID=97097 RepID=UPI00053096BB
PPKLKEMKNQEAAVGQKLVLRCETTSEYPALRFKWLKNGKEITKKNRPENIKIPKKQKKYSELHIYRATLADAGEYACRVSSKLGNDSTKASVIITDTNESTSKIPASTEGTKTSS